MVVVSGWVFMRLTKSRPRRGKIMDMCVLINLILLKKGQAQAFRYSCHVFGSPLFRRGDIHKTPRGHCILILPLNDVTKNVYRDNNWRPYLKAIEYIAEVRVYAPKTKQKEQRTSINFFHNIVLARAHKLHFKCICKSANYPIIIIIIRGTTTHINANIELPYIVKIAHKSTKTPN